jgi:hypothetical protein
MQRHATALEAAEALICGAALAAGSRRWHSRDCAVRRPRRRRAVGGWRDIATAVQPLYAIAGAKPLQGGASRSSRGECRVDIFHAFEDAKVEVETIAYAQAPQITDAVLLDHWIRRTVRPPEQFPADLHADRWTREIPCGTASASFTFAGDQTAWCAAAVLGTRQVWVRCRGRMSTDFRLATVDLEEVETPTLADIG